MLALPFDDTPYAVWEQDFNGNIIQSIPAAQFKLERDDYSNKEKMCAVKSQYPYTFLHIEKGENTTLEPGILCLI